MLTRASVSKKNVTFSNLHLLSSVCIEDLHKNKPSPTNGEVVMATLVETPSHSTDKVVMASLIESQSLVAPEVDTEILRKMEEITYTASDKFHELKQEYLSVYFKIGVNFYNYTTAILNSNVMLSKPALDHIFKMFQDIINTHIVLNADIKVYKIRFDVFIGKNDPQNAKNLLALVTNSSWYRYQFTYIYNFYKVISTEILGLFKLLLDVIEKYNLVADMYTVNKLSDTMCLIEGIETINGVSIGIIQHFKEAVQLLKSL
jgi:hypothetical protein